jgi:hypothetical protein
MLDQGAFVGLASIDWDTTPKTATFTGVAGNGYFCNTSSGTFTLNLPAGSVGDIIAVSDYASTFNVPATPAVYSNPESSLGTPDLTVSSVVNFSAPSATVRAQNLYSAVDVGSFTSSDYGVLWETGGTGEGFAASLEAGGQLWVAAYVGSSWQASGQAYLKVDVSSYYNTPGTFYTTIDVSSKQFNLYFQPGGPTSGNQAVSLGTSTAGGIVSTWAGNDGGALGKVNNAMVNFGFTNYNSTFTASVTELRWYYNTAEPSPFQSITTPAVSATPLTISPNGTDKINGTNENSIISVKGICFSLIYVDSTQGWKSIESNSTNPGASFITATGGTITTSGDYKIHAFTGPGTFTVTCLGQPTNTVEYLVVAGGGTGGKDRGGGGGAGGLRHNFPSPSVGGFTVSATSYPITIGAGGAGDSGPGGSNGSNSIFSSITSTGGGKAGDVDSPANGSPGGSGGGSAGPAGTVGNGNTPPVSPAQGFPGGTGAAAPGLPQLLAGGGGGASQAGESKVPGDSPAGPSGRGGDGVQIPQVPTSYGSPAQYFGGGGGGGYDTRGPGGPTSGGCGGLGGGSKGEAGSFPSANPSSSPGVANTGGGSGGGGQDASGTTGNGGSGIVIIRYKFQ